MTAVPDQTTIQQYVGNGTSTQYSYNFLILANTDIAVYVTPSGGEADPIADIQLLGTDYQVFNVGNISGGIVQFYAPSTPPLGSKITVARAMPFSLDTEFVQAQNFSGANLDLAFERVILLIQQLASQFDLRNLQYVFNSFLPQGPNFLPLLTDVDNQVWVSQGGEVVAAELTENPDWSTLRTQLAVNTSGGGAGASLVGYFDTIQSIGTTVNTLLTLLQNKTNGTLTHGGADLVGYYDPNSLTQTTVGAFLSAGGTSIPVGAIIDFAGANVLAGYLKCDGSAVSRTTYSALLNAITFQQAGTLTSSGNSVTGLTDTSIMFFGDSTTGMYVTGTNIPSGTYITAINSSTSITLSNNATGSGSSTLTFYPWGRGDESTTFNLPDLRHTTTFGAGGTPAAHTALPGTIPGQKGGEEVHQPILAELFGHSHSAIVNGCDTGGGTANAARSAGATSPPVPISITTDTQGNSQPFNVMPLGAIVNKLIKY